MATCTIDQGGDVEAGNDPYCDDVVIDMNGAVVVTANHLWGSTEPTETQTFNQLLVESEKCPDQMMVFYKGQRYDEMAMEWVDLPRYGAEISFDPNRRVFILDKCGPESRVGDMECLMPSYTKIIQVRVVATVNDFQMTSDESLVFDVIIGPDCSDDEVTVQRQLSDITYNLTPAAAQEFLVPIFKKSSLNCGLKCYLTQTGVTNGYSSPAIASFDKSNGVVAISSSDITLHDTSIELTVTCTDPVSFTNKASASTTATVTFKNPCYDTVILQQNIEGTVFEASIWQPKFYELPLALSTGNCGEISYFLEGLDQPEPYELIIENGLPGFYIRVTDVDQTGMIPFTLSSCITINGVDKVCTKQENLNINAVNTCPQTQIIAQNIPGVITVVQGNTDSS